jgi:hypothetical protein
LFGGGADFRAGFDGLTAVEEDDDGGGGGSMPRGARDPTDGYLQDNPLLYAKTVRNAESGSGDDFTLRTASILGWLCHIFSFETCKSHRLKVTGGSLRACWIIVPGVVLTEALQFRGLVSEA